jgi:hypothetical protein
VALGDDLRGARLCVFRSSRSIKRQLQRSWGAKKTLE